MTLNADRAKRIGLRVYRLNVDDPEPCQVPGGCSQAPPEEAAWYLPGNGPVCDADLGAYLNHLQPPRIYEVSATLHYNDERGDQHEAGGPSVLVESPDDELAVRAALATYGYELFGLNAVARCNAPLPNGGICSKPAGHAAPGWDAEWRAHAAGIHAIIKATTTATAGVSDGAVLRAQAQRED